LRNPFILEQGGQAAERCLCSRLDRTERHAQAGGDLGL
jgi:hypothetical protein